MKLRIDQRVLLLQALLNAFPERGDFNELALVVFGLPLDQVAVGANLREIALRVVTTAESRGQIDELVRGALKLRPNTIELKSFAAIHLDNVFSQQEQQALVDAARSGGFANEVLLAFFRRSWPARGAVAQPGGHDGDLLLQLVNELGDAPAQSDGRMPLPYFAALLHRQAEGTAAAPKLKKWLEEAMAQRGEDAKALLQQVNQQPTEPDSILFLLLRLETASEGRCTVQAWLSQGERGAMMSIHADDEPRELSSVGKLLSQLLEKFSSNREEAGRRLLIEVMLPQELLCHAVERWELDQGRYKVLCGRKYPVVVRSWERAYDRTSARQIREDWVNKWKDFLAQPPAGLPGAVVWEPDPAQVSALFDRLLDSRVVCLALMHPQHEDRAASSAELTACLDSGTPVALWGRKWSTGTEKPQEEVKQLLADLRQLPEAVLGLRAAARAGEEHVGHSLVLLWDNPNRLPPDALRTNRLVLPST